MITLVGGARKILAAVKIWQQMAPKYLECTSSTILKKNLFPVHCDFDSEAGYVWALVQSFALANNDQFKDYSFGVDHPVNEGGGKVHWNAYRLSLSRMQSIADASTH